MKSEKIKDNKNIILKILFNKKVISVLVVLIIIFGVALGIGEFLKTNSKTTKLRFENIGELATQTAYTSTVEVVDKSRKLFNNFEIPFTQSKYIFSYDTEIKAGINFEKIEWDVDETSKIITVKLPKAMIISRDLKEDTFEVFHEQESIFCSITLSDINQSLEELENKAEKNAVQNGLLERAEENAQVIVSQFIGQVYDLNEWIIKYK